MSGEESEEASDGLSEEVPSPLRSRDNRLIEVRTCLKPGSHDQTEAINLARSGESGF